MLKATIDYEKFELLYSGYPKRDTTFYQAFIANCDTISDATIAAFFEQPISSWSTSHHYFEAVVTNKKGNELKIMREYTMAEYPYLFPLKIYYAEDKYFNCYNIELAHYLDSAIPDYFSNKSMFNNAYFLLKLSDYLYYKK